MAIARPIPARATSGAPPPLSTVNAIPAEQHKNLSAQNNRLPTKNLLLENTLSLVSQVRPITALFLVEDLFYHSPYWFPDVAMRDMEVIPQAR
ncbi:hypothetical protein SEEE2558_26036 [Salmonella enterica subsp. enterica serovar Enteritidis str. 22558]|nr:hypothetical protein SEEE2558_26036 [Salmonella enterica subsp. enterica serovar Enteritidis str. 22558]